MCCFLVFEQKKTTKLGTHGHIVLRVPQTTCKSIKFEKCVNSTHPTEQWTVYINNLFCLNIHKCKLLNISLSRHFIGSTDIQYITVLLYILQNLRNENLCLMHTMLCKHLLYESKMILYKRNVCSLCSKNIH